MKISNDINCNLILSNNVNYPLDYLPYKNTSSIKILQYNSEVPETIYSRIDKHENYDDKITISNPNDGYYTAYELVLPKLSFLKQFLQNVDYLGKDIIDQLDPIEPYGESNSYDDVRFYWWEKFLKKSKYIKLEDIDDIIDDPFKDIEEENNEEENDDEDPPTIIIYINEYGQLELSERLSFPVKVTTSDNQEYIIPAGRSIFGEEDQFFGFWIKDIFPNEFSHVRIKSSIPKAYITEQNTIRICDENDNLIQIPIKVKLSNGIYYLVEEGELEVTENIKNYHIIDLDVKEYQNQYIGYKTVIDEVFDFTKSFYFIDGDTIYHMEETIGEDNTIQGNLVEVSIKDLIDINYDQTNIKFFKDDFVSVCNIRKCFIQAAQDIFKERLGRECFNGKIDKDLIYRRDLLWMTLNVIQYMVDCDQLFEAHRLTQQILSCNGICKKFNKDCGCNKPKLNCGCK